MNKSEIDKKIEEAAKQLSAKQKAIAKMAEPEHKIDAGDLAKLRAGHKPVKEEEQLDEYTPGAGGVTKVQGSRYGSSQKPIDKLNMMSGPSKKDIKKIEKQEKKKKMSEMIELYNEGGLKSLFESLNKDEVPVLDGEETEAQEAIDSQEQLDENLPMTSLKPGHDEKAARFLARQVKGTPVKGKAQSAPQKEGGMKKKMKEEIEEIEESGEMGAVKNTKGSVLMKHKTSGKEINIINTPEAVKQHQARGYEKVSTVKKEEVEQIGEASTYKLGRAAAETKDFPIHHNGEHVGRLEFHTSAGKLHHRVSSVKGVPYEKFIGHPDREKMTNAHVAKHEAEARAHFAKKIKEEVEDIDERQMTEPEMKKREEIVKSMKKGMAGFKQRYGERAKSVMYATATKQAMKEESESEHYKAGHEYAANHAQDSGFKVTARARKKEMLADNPHKKGTPEHADWHRGALAGHQTALDNM